MSLEVWGSEDPDDDDQDHLLEAGWWPPGEAIEALEILRALLHADERGQGQPWADAMERAKDFVEAHDVAKRI